MLSPGSVALLSALMTLAAPRRPAPSKSPAAEKVITAAPVPPPAAPPPEAPAAPAKPAKANGLPTYLLWEFASLGVDKTTEALLKDIITSELRRLLGERLVINPWFDHDTRELVDACGRTAECLADAGGAMGVDRIILGSATTLGDAYNVYLKIVDVRGRQEIAKTQATLQGDRDRMLEAVQTAVLKIVDPSSLAGSLLVDIALDGVTVMVDGTEIGQTPLRGPIEGLTPGEHALKLSSPVMADYFQFVTILHGKQTRVTVSPKVIAEIEANMEAVAVPIYRRWWFWTAIGGVALAAAGGTVLTMSGDDAPNGPPSTSLGDVSFR